MGELTNKDLQDAFMEGFCYAEDIGHTTGKKLAAEAERRCAAAVRVCAAVRGRVQLIGNRGRFLK